MRVAVIMPAWHCTFEDRFFGLEKSLRKRGHDVSFLVLMDVMRRRREIYVPGLPENRIDLIKFRQSGAIPVRSLQELYRYLFNVHVATIGTAKGLEKVHNVISMLGIPKLEVNDIGETFMYMYNPDTVVLPSKFFFEKNIERCSRNGVKPHIVGDIRFDMVIDPVTEEERTALFSKYTLKSQNPFVIFATSAAQRINNEMAELNKKIIQRIKESNFEVVLRLHPNDLAGHKNATGCGQISVQRLYPEVPYLEIGDLIKAMKLCTCMVSVDSTACCEASIFKKYALTVNLHEWLAAYYIKTDVPLHKRRFDGFGIKTERSKNNEYHWLGADCYIDELSDVLRQPDIFNVNKTLCQNHVQEHWYAVDGQASERITALVEAASLERNVQRQLTYFDSFRFLRSISWILRDAVRKVIKKLTMFF